MKKTTKFLLVFALLFVGFILGQFFQIEKLLVSDWEERFEKLTLEEKIKESEFNPAQSVYAYTLRSAIWVKELDKEEYYISSEGTNLSGLVSHPRDSLFYVIEYEHKEFSPLLEESKLLKLRLPFEATSYKDIRKEEIETPEEIDLVVELRSCSEDGKILVLGVDFKGDPMRVELIRFNVDESNYERI